MINTGCDTQHRLERGRFFFEASKAEAERRGVAFNWALETVPGVEHSGSQMAVRASEMLRSADAEPGDYDADGSVGATDYYGWVAYYGTTGVPGLFADGNGDGRIDAADYTVWRDNLAGSALSTTVEAVAAPEPHAATLVLSAVAAAAWRGR